MTFIHAETPPSEPLAVNPASSLPTGTLGDAMDRNLTALGCHVDNYLAAVARELQERGVITGSPQRTDPARRLLGSIVLDCTAMRVAAWTAADDPTSGQQSTGSRRSLGGAIYPARPTPVIVTWDEHLGWCVGLHHDSTRSSRRYLNATRLPAPAAVADFVVQLALGEPMGVTYPSVPALTADQPESRPTPNRTSPGHRRALRLVPDPPH